MATERICQSDAIRSMQRMLVAMHAAAMRADKNAEEHANISCKACFTVVRSMLQQQKLKPAESAFKSSTMHQAVEVAQLRQSMQPLIVQNAALSKKFCTSKRMLHFHKVLWDMKQQYQR